ncbi:MAG: saccharopine dehydrogenase NADP-binding domain-containing protein [Nocardioides sp.]
MTTAIVLGGGGGIGSVAARTPALDPHLELLLADARLSAAQDVAADIGSDQARATACDVSDRAALTALIANADVVVNCVGPFYRFGPSTLAAAIDAGVDYVDVCDDLAPTVTMLQQDEHARERGVRALIGVGNSPGLANLFVRLCDDLLLDRLDRVDIMHVHGVSRWRAQPSSPTASTRW